MSIGRKNLIVSITGVLLVFAVVVIFLQSCTRAPEPDRQQETTSNTEEAQPTERVEDPTLPGETGKDDSEILQPEDTQRPAGVVIPDPNPEKVGLQFPCEVPGHDLKLEKIAPYTGMFVEDGTHAQVTDVAMILMQNTGTGAVEYAEITVKWAAETLVFQVTALPAGERMVVQEKNGKKIPEGDPLEAVALVSHRAKMAIAPELTVQDNGDNSLTVTNLTDETIPTVRVFYKYYMEEEDLYVGGIAFSVRITNLPAHGSMVVQPAHFISASSRVVMASIYES